MEQQDLTAVAPYNRFLLLVDGLGRALILLGAMVLPFAGCRHPDHHKSLMPSASPYAKWSRGPSTHPGYFPIAVWMQEPALAARYKQAGFNTYVALPYPGPTEEHLAALKREGMKLICNQNEVGLKHLDDPTIIGWMQGDEPDIERPQGEGKAALPPITPEQIIAEYGKMRSADSSRPIFLNVAGDPDIIERGVRRGHAEDYPKYAKGSDIFSFDVYPVSNVRPEAVGKLWYVARGIERLIRWSDGRKVIWNCLECTGINNINRKPKPHEVRCETWMSIIHGSRGLVWFVHEFKPVLHEAGLFEDPEMLATVAGLNLQIQSLASVINSPALTNAATVQTENAAIPVALMVRQHGGATYLFAVNMRGEPTKASFQIAGTVAKAAAEVIGENRTIPVHRGLFADQFNPWDVHLYRVPGTAK
jgi:hypothetical protein